MDYPYGKAAFWILVVALVSGVALAFVSKRQEAERPDLVFVTFSKDHADAYRPLIADFERERNCRVQLQIVDLAALQERLTAALQVGAEVPDMVELGVVLMGQVTKGPIEDVGFWDLTEKIKQAGLDRSLVASRFSGYSSRGHTFALPHDVHPLVLAYRRDLVERLGIDVSTLTTWEEFVRVGRQITKDLTGDGVIDRYMIDLPDDSIAGVQILLTQQGQSNFDESGNVAFDTDLTVDTLCWYVRQTEGPTRISFNCKWGQNFSRAMTDGLALFYLCPDWRSRQFQIDIPRMAGKLALMPLPAWTEGGCRTSTWGGTGLAITKACRNKDLAWDLAVKLYYDKDDLGPRFEATNILPPLRDAWTLPVYDQPHPFFSDQPIGRIFADLAPDVAPDYANPYTSLAQAKLTEAYINAKLHYRRNGDQDLRAVVQAEVRKAANAVRAVQNRNVFAKQVD